MCSSEGLPWTWESRILHVVVIKKTRHHRRMINDQTDRRTDTWTEEKPSSSSTSCRVCFFALQPTIQVVDRQKKSHIQQKTLCAIVKPRCPLFDWHRCKWLIYCSLTFPTVDLRAVHSIREYTEIPVHYYHDLTWHQNPLGYLTSIYINEQLHTITHGNLF